MTRLNANPLAPLGLSRTPFPATPDTSAYFMTPALERELVEAAQCLYSRAGFVLLTGEIGMGKSTFVRRLLEEMEREGLVASLVFNTFLQGADLLSAILRDFGLEPHGNAAADVETLNRFLIELWRNGHGCVLVIDDAQNLDLESLELLRLLTNLETGREKLLQIVLAGQPELRDNLDQPRIRQLTSRIVKHVRLEAMDAVQILDYVHFRLQACGAGGRIGMGRAAAAALHAASGGNPRRIHLIMERCLYGLIAHGRHDIDPALVRAAAAEAGALPARPRHPAMPRLAVAASIGLVLLSTLGGLLSRQTPAHAATVAAAAPPSGIADSWQQCLRRLSGHGPVYAQPLPLPPRWRTRIAARGDVCIGTGSGAAATLAWRAVLRPESFDTASAHPDVRLAQHLLATTGHYDGAIDGRHGPRTRAALARFQHDNGQPASGTPTPATLLLIDTLSRHPDNAAAHAGPRAAATTDTTGHEHG